MGKTVLHVMSACWLIEYMSLRLQAALGMNADLLMRVQASYEIWQASQQIRPHIELLLTHHV